MDYKNKFDLTISAIKDNVERINVHEISTEEFIERYEKPYRPVIIKGITDKWKANYKWTLDVSIL